MTSSREKGSKEVSHAIPTPPAKSEVGQPQGELKSNSLMESKGIMRNKKELGSLPALEEAKGVGFSTSLGLVERRSELSASFHPRRCIIGLDDLIEEAKKLGSLPASRGIRRSWVLYLTWVGGKEVCKGFSALLWGKKGFSGLIRVIPPANSDEILQGGSGWGRWRTVLLQASGPEDGLRCDFEQDAESFHGRLLEWKEGSIYGLEGSFREFKGALGIERERMPMPHEVLRARGYSETLLELGRPGLNWGRLGSLPGGRWRRPGGIVEIKPMGSSLELGIVWGGPPKLKFHWLRPLPAMIWVGLTGGDRWGYAGARGEVNFAWGGLD
ncbi:hypothetical protein MA16_Dca017511 [Dendrobium catenatum]|uniref:Uncharacterized protein n=1 Tax=Dendrobium catenatum TaxID=906689 RepID=A0A2I0X300_9ASPA|nr:hypothetical protein MA16_Dca017511 [Dendrobium catenatum]